MIDLMDLAIKPPNTFMVGARHAVSLANDRWRALARHAVPLQVAQLASVCLVQTRIGIAATGLVAVAAIVLAACAPAAQPTPVAPITPTRAVASPTPQPSKAATTTPTPAATLGPAKQETPTPMSQASPTPGIPPALSPTPRQADCPNLESRLYGLSTATDPAAFANTNGLYFANGKVRVVVELQRPEDALPAGYDIAVETRQSNLVQALVPIDDLCRLSKEPQVRFVRAPFESAR